MPMTDKVEELLRVIGPFYEIVEDKKSKSPGIKSGWDTKLLLLCYLLSFILP